MDDNRFWAIIGEAYRADLVEQVEALKVALGSLTWPEVLEFQAIFDVKLAAVDTPDLRGAARLIHGDASEGAFHNFALGLVASGQRAYEAALAEADSLADFLDGDPVDGYGLDKVPVWVYEDKTGGSDFYERLAQEFSRAVESAKLPHVPRLDPNDFPRRFPRLSRLYGTPDEGQK